MTNLERHICRGIGCKFSWLAGCLFLVLSGPTHAALIDFETPTYTAGSTIVGVDGWVIPPFATNNESVVTPDAAGSGDTRVLAGAQSARLWSDVATTFVVRVFDEETIIGNGAVLSARMLTDGTAGRAEVLFTNDLTTGSTPLGIIANAGGNFDLFGSSLATDSGVPVVNNADYLLEMEMDMRNQTFEGFVTNLTAAGPRTSLGSDSFGTLVNSIDPNNGLFLISRGGAVGIFDEVDLDPGAPPVQLSVSDIGLNTSGNRELRVEVSPDTSLFSDTEQGLGGSLAVELAFEIAGSDLLGATVNTTDWPTDIPGNNPFTESVTQGVDLDLAGDTLFASLGSEFLTSGSAVEVFVIETMGSGETTVTWGGQTLLLDTPHEYIGSRISQAGINLDGYQGDITVLAIGDMNGDGGVNDADVPLFVLALTDRLAYETAQPEIDADVIGDFDGNGKLDLGDIAGFKSAAFGLASARANVVPEPGCALLFALAAWCVLGVNPRHRSLTRE